MWLLIQQLGAHCHLRADVVFLGGTPLKRAMRWAKIINTVTAVKRCPGLQQIQYFLGPETDRRMGYYMEVDDHELEKAGMGNLGPWRGGYYDVILQASPLDGFSSDFSSQETGVEYALGKLTKRSSAVLPLHIIVGSEHSSSNSPNNGLHVSFRKYLNDRGFSTVFVDDANYVNSDAPIYSVLPSTLAEVVKNDEWNKAVGRMHPSRGSLLSRFRVNVQDNYQIISRAFHTWQVQQQSDDKSSATLAKAENWWNAIAEEVTQCIMDGYVGQSRACDQNRGKDALGNPAIKEIPMGLERSWKTMMSVDCLEDIMNSFEVTEDSLLQLSVDEVMGKAVALMTGKLLTIFAFSVFAQGSEPDKRQYTSYILGNDSAAPLDFYMFPRVLGEMTGTKKHMVITPD
jgi:hypothetical protein